MTLLYGVAPPLMASRLRRGAAAERAPSAAVVGQAAASSRRAAVKARLLPGGQPVLAALGASATGIAVSRVWADAGHPDSSQMLASIAAACGSVAAGVPEVPAALATGALTSANAAADALKHVMF